MSFITYAHIPSLERHIGGNGLGTIYLEPYQQVRAKNGTATSGEGRALENLADAERVYRIIEERMVEMQSLTIQGGHL